MKRVSGLTSFVIAVFCIGLGAFCAVAQFADVKVKSQRVAGTVHMLEGAGGNIGVTVGDDGVLMIDTQFAPLADKIRAAIAGLSQHPVKFVLNTHWHGDHTGGNAKFSDATILAHENVRSRMVKKSPDDKPAFPVITYKDGIAVHFNGELIRVTHFPPSHTDGDSVVHFTGSNVVHLGDLFFSGRFPFVDLASGGNVAGLIKNIEKLVETLPKDIKIIPGHGPLSTLEDLKTYLGMLKETMGIIRKGIAAGKDRDALIAEGLPGKWASWGTGFIKTKRWIGIVYESYSGKTR